MKHPKPNTPEQLSRINAEIHKKSRRWIYYNALDNPHDSGWCRKRACDFLFLIGEVTHSHSKLRYQLAPPSQYYKII